MRTVITPSRLITVLSVSLCALLASPAKVTYDNFGIAEGPVTTVHTITAHIRARVANLLMAILLPNILSVHPLATDTAKTVDKRIHVRWHDLASPHQYVYQGSDLDNLLVIRCQRDP